MKLWEKDLPFDREVERFTSENDRRLDLRLAEYDALGSIAHARMLAAVGLLTAEESSALCAALRRMCAEAREGRFAIRPDAEDVHSEIEARLTEALGDAGRKIHAGRSRNDQALLDVQLSLRDAIRSIAEAARDLFYLLLDLSEQHRDHLLPGYTHMQVAMPSSFGLWFAAHAETIAEDVSLLRAAYRLADRNPLGSAAGYGSPFPVDRALTTELLGFEMLHVNSLGAQLARGRVERAAAQAAAMLASSIARLAMDITLYLSPNFAFLSLDDAFTTGSSIMPHKKNPDVFELIRARCNALQGVPAEIAHVTGNLASGYHRDMQILKELLFPRLDDLLQCMRMLTRALPHLTVRTDILSDPKYDAARSVESVHARVRSGMSFREAYRAVADEIATGAFVPPPPVPHTHEGSIGNLRNDLIRKYMEDELAAFAFERRDRAFALLLADE